jgi:hypothetical protein
MIIHVQCICEENTCGEKRMRIWGSASCDELLHVYPTCPERPKRNTIDGIRTTIRVHAIFQAFATGRPRCWYSFSASARAATRMMISFLSNGSLRAPRMEARTVTGRLPVPVLGSGYEPYEEVDGGLGEGGLQRLLKSFVVGTAWWE